MPNIKFVNSWISVASRTAHKDAFIHDSLHSKPSTAASAMGSWAQSLASWLAPSCLLTWITLQYVDHDGRFCVIWYFLCKHRISDIRVLQKHQLRLLDGQVCIKGIHLQKGQGRKNTKFSNGPQKEMSPDRNIMLFVKNTTLWR